jgi:signal transduction histidine kinase
VLFVAFYSLAAYGTDRRSTIGALALCVVAYAVPLLPPQSWPVFSPALWGPAACFAWVSLLGASVRRRRLEAEERTRRAAATAEAQARERLTADRLRVARELHDVLAHTISVISVQSGVALDALDDDLPAVRGALHVIRGSTRQALAELRATLELLRAEADGVRPERPQPGLAQLAELVARAEAGGVVVEFDGGDVGPLPPAVELTVYRLVQEALTNVLRHSGAGRAGVSLRRGDGTVTVEVVDDGRGPAEAAAGFGLRGMAERVAAVGGELVTGAGADGGFRVRAELPVPE